MSDKQHTLKAKSEVKGVGLHTGEEVTLTLCPAPIGHGLKFQRTDLEGAIGGQSIGRRSCDFSLQAG